MLCPNCRKVFEIETQSGGDKIMWIETQKGNLVNLDNVCALCIFAKILKENKFHLVALLTTSSGYEGAFSSEDIEIWEGSEEECYEVLRGIKKLLSEKGLL